MRIEVGSRGLNGRNESWYFVEIDEDGNAFYVHRWHNLPYSGPVDEGETRIPLDEAVGEPFYREAVQAAASRTGKA